LRTRSITATKQPLICKFGSVIVVLPEAPAHDPHPHRNYPPDPHRARPYGGAHVIPTGRRGRWIRTDRPTSPAAHAGESAAKPASHTGDGARCDSAIRS